MRTSIFSGGAKAALGRVWLLPGRIAAVAVALLAVTMAPVHAAPEPYVIDKSHASVNFRISHLGFSEVYGQFREFDADIMFDPEAVESSSVVFRIEVNSVDTNWDARDNHIRRADILDANSHPQIVFESTRIESMGEDRATLTGSLTMLGVTKEETFDVTLNRSGEMRGKLVYGFEAKGEIDRTRYGSTAFAPGIGTMIPVAISLEISPK